MSYFYEIRAHFGKDLPKADTFGEIDAYLRFFVPGIESMFVFIAYQFYINYELRLC